MADVNHVSAFGSKGGSDRRSSRSDLVLITVAVFALVFGSFIIGTSVGKLSVHENSFASPWSEGKNRSIIEDYFRRASVHKLNIGAGDNDLPGWLNTDIEPHQGQAYLDASKRFPLGDASMQYIFSEHMI